MIVGVVIITLGTGDDVWVTSTLVHYTDARPDGPGIVVAANLVAPGR